MQIVISISDSLYDRLIDMDIDSDTCSFNESALVESIKNGTPLPKGHGRLGDLDALRKEISSWGMNDYEPSDFIDEIDIADVIIEADKEGER